MINDIVFIDFVTLNGTFLNHTFVEKVFCRSGGIFKMWRSSKFVS